MRLPHGLQSNQGGQQVLLWHYIFMILFYWTIIHIHWKLSPSQLLSISSISFILHQFLTYPSVSSILKLSYSTIYHLSIICHKRKWSYWVFANHQYPVLMVQFQGNARPAWFVEPGAGLQIPQSQRDEHGGGQNYFPFLDHPQGSQWRKC